MSDMYLRIRKARRCVGVSQEEFAGQLGVSRGAVAQWEMIGGTSPKVENLEQIAVKSGCYFEWIATGRGPQKFGAPVMLKEEPEIYGVPLSDQEKRVIAGMRKMSPAKRAAVVELVNGG